MRWISYEKPDNLMEKARRNRRRQVSLQRSLLRVSMEILKFSKEVQVYTCIFQK